MIDPALALFAVSLGVSGGLAITAIWTRDRFFHRCLWTHCPHRWRQGRAH